MRGRLSRQLWDIIAINHGNRSSTGFPRDKSNMGFADGHVELHQWEHWLTFHMYEGHHVWPATSVPESPDLQYLQLGYIWIEDNS